MSHFDILRICWSEYVGFAEQNLLNPQLRSLKGFNLALESVSMLRVAKTIILQGCDVENTLERTSVMAPKGVSLILVTYYAAGHSNVTNCMKNTCMHGISMHYIPDE